MPYANPDRATDHQLTQDLLRPLAKAYGRFKDIATVPVLKIVFQELKGKLVVPHPNKHA